jgi:hypothetical protein
MQAQELKAVMVPYIGAGHPAVGDLTLPHLSQVELML